MWKGIMFWVLFFGAATTLPTSFLDSWLYTAERPMIISHRGSRFLNPENTLLAFYSALELGADVIEMDVRLTSDNHLVVFHDSEVNRTTNGSGSVREKTLEDMLSLDAGYKYTHDGGQSYPYRAPGTSGQQVLRVPTFEAFLSTFPSKRINVEIKDDELLAADLTWELLKQQPHCSSRFVVVSRFCNVINHFRNITQGAIATASCENEATNMRIKIFLGSDGARSLDHYLGLPLPPASVYQLPTIVGDFPMEGQEMIDYLHSIGSKVHYWVVNDARYMERLLTKGIDGLITDRPDIAYAVWQKLGFVMPPTVAKPRWQYFVPLVLPQELHECVTLLCLFFAFGLAAICALLVAILTVLVLVTCLVRKTCAVLSQSRSSATSHDPRKADKVKKA